MNKRLIFFFICLVFLNGCPQSTALMGPAITTVATGNVYQAGASYGFNYTIEKNTGMPLIKHVEEALQPKKKVKVQKDFILLVENQIKKTRAKLFNKKKLNF